LRLFCKSLPECIILIRNCENFCKYFANILQSIWELFAFSLLISPKNLIFSSKHVLLQIRSLLIQTYLQILQILKTTDKQIVNDKEQGKWGYGDIPAKKRTEDADPQTGEYTYPAYVQ